MTDNGVYNSVVYITIYSELSIKTIQCDWDEFCAASVCAGTARQQKFMPVPRRNIGRVEHSQIGTAD
uniref:hypothetical protein n=1 Tax=Psychrobacter celer TaxID=306572 RepID=UPI001D021BA9